MMNVLAFLRLTDDDGLLSLTHIALMVVIAKVAFVQHASVVDLGGLLLGLANYSGKKIIDRTLPTYPMSPSSPAVPPQAAIAVEGLSGPSVGGEAGKAA